MKNLITLIGMALIVFNTSINAQDMNLEEELFNYNQVGKINAAMLNEVDDKINQVKVKFDLASENLDAGSDHVEGKILAAMIISIEDKIDQIEQRRALLDDKYEIVDRDLEEIEQGLQGVEVLIHELSL